MSGSIVPQPIAKIVSVVGGGAGEGDAVLDCARELGAALVDAGYRMACGGLGGVMRAASEGARSRGGDVLGVLPGRDPTKANEFVTIPLATGLGEARNTVLATCCHAMVAVGGEFGTLSEVAFALKLGKPVFALQSKWGSIPGVQSMDGVAETIAAIGRS